MSIEPILREYKFVDPDWRPAAGCRWTRFVPLFDGDVTKLPTVGPATARALYRGAGHAYAYVVEGADGPTVDISAAVWCAFRDDLARGAAAALAAGAAYAQRAVEGCWRPGRILIRVEVR